MDFYNVTSRHSRRSKRRGANAAPDDFDADACPILAIHFFGLEPPRPVGPIAAEAAADLRFRRKVKQDHRLGDRVFGELLAELGAERGVTTIIDRKLDTFAELEPKVLEAAGGDTFSPVPIHGVRP